MSAFDPKRTDAVQLKTPPLCGVCFVWSVQIRTDFRLSAAYVEILVNLVQMTKASIALVSAVFIVRSDRGLVAIVRSGQRVCPDMNTTH